MTITATLIRVAIPNGEVSAEPFVAGLRSVAEFEKSTAELFRAGKVDLQPPAEELLSKIETWPRLDGLPRGLTVNEASKRCLDDVELGLHGANDVVKRRVCEKRGDTDSTKIAICRLPVFTTMPNIWTPSWMPFS